MTQRTPQYGQGMVEFLLAAPVVLLMGLGSIEAIHWHFVRQAVSEALLQAGRAAVTRHADPQVLDTAFREALLPLHAAPSREESRTRLERAMARRETDTGLPAWRIEILSPSAASFEDFASDNPELPPAPYPVIDNDYLDVQHEAYLQQGWPEGRGKASGQSILEANSLRLHLTWLHEPLLPGMKLLMRQLAPSDSRYGSRAMALGGYLPIQRHLVLMMQSHAIAWEMPAHGRVARSRTGERPDIPTGLSPEPPSTLQPSCQGLWCPNSPVDLPKNLAPYPDKPDTTPNPPHTGSDFELPGNANGPENEPIVDPDDCPGCCE